VEVVEPEVPAGSTVARERGQAGAFVEQVLAGVAIAQRGPAVVTGSEGAPRDRGITAWRSPLVV